MPTTLFSTAYCAPIQYYWHWNRANDRMLEVYEHYSKQSWKNRCLIATANGPMALTIPIEGGAEQKAIRDVRISEHGNWRHLHWNSIQSAYNSSPFFEYYMDDLSPFFEKKYAFLLDFNEAIREIICEWIDLDAAVQKTTIYQHSLDLETIDLRTLIQPKKDPLFFDAEFKIRPYYQVFEHKYNFLPNLSILDLLFNLGPEAILFL